MLLLQGYPVSLFSNFLALLKLYYLQILSGIVTNIIIILQFIIWPSYYRSTLCLKENTSPLLFSGDMLCWVKWTGL